MRKTKFIFDSHTLEYRLVEKDKRKRLLKFLSYFAGSIVIAIAYIAVFEYFFDSPEERKLKRENQELVLNYQLLDKKIASADQRLNRIQKNDDQMYRTIFELEPIPDVIRNAGFGGVNRYEKYDGWLNSDEIIRTTSYLDRISKKLYVQTKSYDEITFLTQNKEKYNAARPAIIPVAPKDYRRISDYYGWRKDPFTGKRKQHKGLDFSGPKGKNIYSTGDGVVVDVRYTRFGYGKVVTIDHGFGFKTKYAHLHKWLVKKGQKVKRGDAIGLMGSTGRSTGPHLHYEVIHKGKKLNPLNYFRRDVTDEEFERIVNKEDLLVNRKK